MGRCFEELVLNVCTIYLLPSITITSTTCSYYRCLPRFHDEMLDRKNRIGRHRVWLMTKTVADPMTEEEFHP